MAQDLLLSVQDAYVTFGKTPLFDGLSFNIHAGGKICLVGKNGAGKTTLMHIISGERELDGGKREELPGLRVGYLQQDVQPDPTLSVFDYVYDGLPKDRRTGDYDYMVEMVSEPLSLPLKNKMRELSGGQVRRAALARALVNEPDILMLDEPTNHLDLEAIQWLEDYLKYYQGTVLCISHDRTFLSNFTDKVFWLDRGKIRVCPRGFSHFEEWSTQLLEQEERELKNRAATVAQEVAWASRGMKARRKRNVRRLEQMKEARAKLKADKSLFRQTMSKVELAPIESSQISKIVAEFYKAHKAYDQKTILDGFNLRIMRGDRIGILGKNGSGKTSFLKMLIGDVAPDKGSVKLAKTAEISYFDQNRESLNPKQSLRKNLCPNGGDHVNVGGKQRHVCGYLKDFMFDPRDADILAGTLSGGQKNRLMLAKVLAHPGNLLILDEPTNDLDMETLDMLEGVLSRYDGTLIVVSHDRDFLDQTITKVLAFEGDGNVDGYIGGYSDYLLESGKAAAPKNTKPKATQNTQPKPKAKPSQKLTYNLQRELSKLPTEIETLQTTLDAYEAQLANPGFYTENPKEFDRISRKYALEKDKLAALEERWLELEAMKEDG